MRRERVGDILVVASLVLACGVLIWSTGRDDYRTVDFVLVAVVLVSAFCIWAWMMGDVISEVARERTSGRVAWLGAMFAFWPLAYLYYFVSYRRRRIETPGLVPRSRRAAETAFLLLLVVGTIAFLIVLLVRHVTSTLGDGACQTNLRDIANAIEMYVADNDGLLPSAHDWRDQLMGYVENEEVFLCPESTDNSRGYAYNKSIGGLPLAEIKELRSDMVVIFETDAADYPAGGPELLPDEPRHSGRDNYVWADGSASGMRRKRLPDGTWAKEPETYWVRWEPVAEEGAREPDAGE